jgi:hypothetical protein
MWSTESLWFDAAVVLGLFAVGNILFGHFEEHKPKAKRLAKVALFLGLTLALSAGVGRAWAMGLLALALLGATYIHLVWLPRNGVDGWTGEPRQRYYELIGHDPARAAGPRRERADVDRGGSRGRSSVALGGRRGPARPAPPPLHSTV